MPNPVHLASLSGRKRPHRFPGRQRAVLMAALFTVAFVILGVRLVDLGLAAPPGPGQERTLALSTALDRPAIVDRAGRVLASDIVTGSLYANPQRIVDLDDTVEQITAILGDLEARPLRGKLSAQTKFQWIARKLAPRLQQAVHELGLPGLDFVAEPHRVYPSGAVAAHVLGHVDVDNAGLAGIETWIDRAPRIERAEVAGTPEPGTVTLAMDLRVQYALREELADALQRYKAKAAAGVVLDVHSGEIVSLVSLPDYDPNQRNEALDAARYNRLTSGVYELGSVFKMFTLAAALDHGVTSLEGGYDAREPIRVGGFTIRDFHAKRRWLSTPEIFIYSSNIGSAKMAVDLGAQRHKEFLGRLGLLRRHDTEIGPTAAPLLPARWRRVNTMTISYGHGLSVAPLQLVSAAAALVNGGHFIEPTFLRRSREEAGIQAQRVIKEETSDLMRYLMRLNVQQGSGKRADAKGYRVGGKTGTAEKVVAGRYAPDALLTSFLGVFPSDAPAYAVLIMLDEPQGTEETGGQATAGVNAAAVTGRLVARIGPMLGLAPRLDRKGPFDEPLAASY